MTMLSPSDQLFLLLERRNQPMHVGGLILLKPQDEATGFNVSQLAARMRAHDQAVAPFNQRLHSRLGVRFWTEDTEFDLDAHFFHLSLPKPGRIRELLELVSKLHASQMDRAKPLWEAYLIDGLEDGRAALYVKVHNALVDGGSFMKMIQHSMAETPQSADLPPFWASPAMTDFARRTEAAESLTGAMGQALTSVRTQLSSLPKVIKEVGRSVYQTSVADPDYVSVLQAPRSVINRRITGSRRFAAQSWDIARIKACAQNLDMTLNDVVLAMVGTALRKYLLDLQALPARPLVAMVPVSLRTKKNADKNQLALLLANLATDTEDPIDRIEQIARSVNHSKSRFEHMSQTEVVNFVAAMMGLSGLNFLTGLAPKIQAFNIVVSNVPGPLNRLYFNGLEVDGIYPLSLLLDGQALSLTLNRYADRLEFGLLACRRTLPSMQRLLQFLEEGLQELEAAAEQEIRAGMRAAS